LTWYAESNVVDARPTLPRLDLVEDARVSRWRFVVERVRVGISRFVFFEVGDGDDDGRIGGELRDDGGERK
jgi:hypothetical protein